MENLFYKGEIHMKRLNTFTKISNNEIGDKDEGITCSHQKSEIKSFTVNGKNMTSSLIRISLRESNAPNPFIYCTYGIYKKNNENTQKVVIDTKCFEFGDTAVVIYNPKTFIYKIQQSYHIEYDKITYREKDKYSGDMGIFSKFDNYSHQEEFRIINYEKSNLNEINLDIGSIEDISIIVNVNELNPIILEY